MKYYKVTGGDLFAVSLVEDPAIESNFIALSKEIPIKMQEEKRLLVGAALVPNKPIYRNMNGKEFYISFDEETIERLAQDFLANDYQHNITVGHQEDADDIVVVESWIKTSDNDKSVTYGLDEPIGTWFIAVKVNNDKIWQMVKDGVYRGFSIEAMVGLDELINNNNIDLSMDKELIEQIRDIIYEAMGKKKEEEEEVKKEEVNLESLTKLKEDNAKLLEDVANLSAEVERLKSERDELESKLKDAEAEKEKMNVDLEAVKAENVKLSAQPSAKPARQAEDTGKNYAAAVKLQLK